VVTGGDQPGDVRHVHQQLRARLPRDLAEHLEVDLARVGAGAATITFGRCSSASSRSWS
jgi:hypothetical protein